MRPSTRPSERLGVIVICAAHFLVGVDGLAVAIALPAVQRDLGGGPIDGQWVLSAYGLAFGGSLLLGGRLGDLYGRRRILAGGLGLFAVGSLTAGVAPSLGALVAARVLQGLGAAAAVPAALALIGSLFDAGARRTRALSLLAAMASVGTLTGLLLGGAVVELLGWRWVFFTTAPLAAAAAYAASRLLPEARAASEMPGLDVPGALLVTTGLASVLFGLTRIEHGGAGAIEVVGPMFAGLVLLSAFVLQERRAPAPLMRLAILRVRSLRAASIGGGANSVAFTAIVYVGTLYLQLALGYSPFEAGLGLLALDVVAFVVPLTAASAIARRAPRPLLLASFTLTVLALLWLARAPVPADYARDMLGPLVVLGASLSVAFVVLTQEAVADVEPDERGLASGVFETSNHLLGGAVGVAVYATLLTGGGGYRAAFLGAAVLALGGVGAAFTTRSSAPTG